jgi:hypothetical protein
MKTFSNYFIPGLCVIALLLGMCKGSPSDKEVKTGKAGDHLDLFAVMNTFENSGSPGSFEKSLNSKSKGVNNLDLNEDGETDYIKVTDKKIDDQSHVLVLQVDVAPGKTQDVATIEIQKTAESTAHLQIIGDDDLYGSDYIVEPKSNEAAAGFAVATTFAVNVWSWPAVAYIYSPGYVVYASPYHYEYYPVWWEPWPVVVYDVYYPVVAVYHTHYAYSDGYRFVNIHEHYHDKYRVTTSFRYHEKNHGVSHTKINVQERHKDGGDGNVKRDKHDAVGKDKQAAPSRDNKGNSPAKYDNKNSGGKDYRKPSGNDGSGVKKYPAPKSQPKQQSNPQPKGGKQPGGAPKGGGKHK